jgi:hypothetical protein
MFRIYLLAFCFFSALQVNSAYACSARARLPMPINNTSDEIERWRRAVLLIDADVRIAVRVVEIKDRQIWTNSWSGLTEDKRISVPVMVVEVLPVANSRMIFTAGRTLSVVAPLPCSNEFSRFDFKPGDQLGVLTGKPSRFGDFLEIDGRETKLRVLPLKDAWFVGR